MKDDFDDDVTPKEDLPTEVADKLKASFGEFAAVKTTAGWVAMKCPRKATYDRYHAMLYKEAERAPAQEFISKACIIYANGVFADAEDEKGGQLQVRAAFSAMLDKKPGIISACANCALEAAGVDSEATTKKYGAS